jgi:nucleotide-binding universal stress UspA family protein
MIAKHGIDLIVIGTRGRRGVRKLLLGSVAEEIYRLADPPVLTVGPRAVSSKSRAVSLKRILYATDLSPESVSAMDYAWSLSTEFQAQLLVARIEEGDQGIPKANVELREFFEAWEKAKGLKESRGLPPEFLVEAGSPADRVLEIASEQRVDLIVLGIRAVSFTEARVLAHLAGRTADKIVAGSSCPVLTIRQKPRSHPTRRG